MRLFRLFSTLIITLSVALPVYAQQKFTVAIKHDASLNTMLLRNNYKTVCADENCYYVVDKDTAEMLVAEGIGDNYEEVAVRSLATIDTAVEKTTSVRNHQWMLQKEELGWEEGRSIIETELPNDIRSNHGNSAIAVLDTGMALHIDLLDILWDIDGYGTYGLSLEDNFAGTTDLYAQDYEGHGSHVSGIAAAYRQAEGMASTGYGKTHLIGLKVTNTKKVTTDTVIAAIGKVIDMKKSGVPIAAVNMSFGGPVYNAAEEAAIESLREAGIIAVAAAGNDGKNIATSKSYPASYQLDNIVVVAALNENLSIEPYSNYGGATSIAAPGSAIYSTATAYSGAKPLPNNLADDSYIAYDSQKDATILGEGWQQYGGQIYFDGSLVSAEDEAQNLEVDDIDLSLISNFPNNTVSLSYSASLDCLYGECASLYISYDDTDIWEKVGNLYEPSATLVRNIPQGVKTVSLRLTAKAHPNRANNSISVYRLFVGGSKYADSYMVMSGTSMAAPFVTGAIGAAKALYPEIEPHQLIKLLYASANHPDNISPEMVRGSNVINLGNYFAAVLDCKYDSSKCDPQLDGYPYVDPEAKPSPSGETDDAVISGGSGCSISTGGSAFSDSILLLASLAIFATFRHRTNKIYKSK